MKKLRRRFTISSLSDGDAPCDVLLHDNARAEDLIRSFGRKQQCVPQVSTFKNQSGWATPQQR